MATLLKDGRGLLGMTTTMTTTTRPTGGRENADNFAGYVNEDDNDDPGGRGCAREATREEDVEEGG